MEEFRRSIRQTTVLLILAGILTLGYLGGRTFARQGQRFGGLHSLLRSANAGNLGALGDAEGAGSGGDVPPAEIFEAVYERVQHDYVEDVSRNSGKLSHGAIARMIASLDDPRSLYLEPALSQARQEARQGVFHGIGAVLTVTLSQKQDVEYRHLTVVAVMPDSPAEKVGLLSGDHITEVNGRWIIAYSPLSELARLEREEPDEATRRDSRSALIQKFKRGYSLTRVLPLLETGEGRNLRLKIQRPGEPTPRPLELTTATTRVEPVEYRSLSSNVGYLRIRQFSPQATKRFQEELNRLDPETRGLVVDLRGNPGGIQTQPETALDGLTSVSALLGMLTPGGEVATLEHQPRRPEPLRVSPEKSALRKPLVVLIDSGTANLAELTASVLRDKAKARLLGNRTFGDPILPLFIPLKNGAAIELAHTRLGIKGTAGVEPDVRLASAAMTDEDALLKRAVMELRH